MRIVQKDNITDPMQLTIILEVFWKCCNDTSANRKKNIDIYSVPGIQDNIRPLKWGRNRGVFFSSAPDKYILFK